MILSTGGHACPGGGCARGACMLGGMHGWGACMMGAMHARGHAWQGVCMPGARVAGVYMLGGMCGGGHAWWGACMVGGMHDTPPTRYYGYGIQSHPTGMHSCLKCYSEQDGISVECQLPTFQQSVLHNEKV